MIEGGRVDEARMLLERCIRAHPRSASCWSALGIAQASGGDTNSAATSWRQAVELDPSLQAAHLNLAQLASQSGDPAGAAVHFRSAARLSPKDASVWKRLGEAELAAGDLTAARDAFDEGLKHAPADAALLVGLGKVYLFSNHLAEARRVLERAVASDPDNREARLFQAVALAEDTGASVDLVRTETVLAAALQEGFAVESAAYGLGMIALRRGRPADAAVLFRRAVEANPSNERAQYRLARALMAAGQAERGRQELLRHDRMFRLNRQIIALRLRLEMNSNDADLKRRLRTAQAARSRQ